MTANQSPNALLRHFKRLFPNQSVKEIGAGWTSTAFEAGDKIIHVPRVDMKQYEKEARLLDFLQGRLSVPVPHPRIVHGSVSYAIHTKIEGNKWNIETYNAPDNAAKDLFARDIAAFFAELHALPVDEITQALPPEDLSLYPLADRKAMGRYLAGEISAADIDALYIWCRDMLKPTSPAVLAHKDFWEGNSVVDSKHRLCGVFFWVKSTHHARNGQEQQETAGGGSAYSRPRAVWRRFRIGERSTSRPIFYKQSMAAL